MKKNGGRKSFSDSEGKVMWAKVVAWVENLINICIFAIYLINICIFVDTKRLFCFNYNIK